MDTVEALRWMSSPAAPVIGQAANEIERLRAEVAMLRTGDTCARQCEGTAYRIEVQRLRARLEWSPEHPEHDGIYCRDETIRLQDRQIANLKSALESKQAKIDALMLEFCPGEMPAAQVGNWAKHQRPVDENTRDAINSAASDQTHIAKLRADVERLRKLLWAWRWAGYSRARDAETDSVLGGWNPDAGVTLADEAQAMGLYDVPGDEKR